MPRLSIVSPLILALIASTAHPSTAQDKVFVGYLYGPPKKLNYKLYTHICHAFLLLEEDGKIKPSRLVPNRDLTADAHSHGVKVLISLGGWGYDAQFASIVAHPEAEDRYVKGVLEVVEGSDYDGIDLDWEYPDTKDEVAGFERVCRRFRKGLDAIGLKKGRKMDLTMAASSNPGTLRWLGKDFLVETMDWINVMTYDYAGDWSNYAGHNSPLFASSKQPSGKPVSTEASMRYLLEDRGIPANKLAVGIPLYGRAFAVAEPYASTKGVPRANVPAGTYAKILQLKDEKGWTRRWDDQTKVPWLIAPDHSSVIGYDDVESVAIKADWAGKQGFRGVFFWQIDGDRLPDGSNPLQEAAAKGLARPGK